MRDELVGHFRAALFAVFGENYSMSTLMKIDPVMWTLCVEAAFYVVLPLLGLVAFLSGDINNAVIRLGQAMKVAESNGDVAS